MSRLISFFFLFTVTNLLFGQSPDSVVNLTDLETQKDYFTKNTFSIDNDGLHLFYSIRYDDKNSVDEEFIRTIYILIPSATLTKYSVKDLLKYYSEQGALIVERDTQDLTGSLTLREVSDSSIKADFNIEIIFNGQVLNCTGEKKFITAHNNK